MCILPFEAQIKHTTRTIERNHAIKAEVTFCVRGVLMPSCADTRAYSPRCRSADVLISAAQVSLSGLAKNAPDLRDSNPINLCHLGDRHAVFHPRADAGKLRAWNLDRRRREGDCCLRLIRQDGYQRRNHRQHAQLACRGRAHLRGGWRTDLRFREQRFGLLARLHGPLAIISARMRLLFSTKQDFPPETCSHSRGWQSTQHSRLNYGRTIDLKEVNTGYILWNISPRDFSLYSSL